MPFPVGGDFLPDPREGSAADFLLEKSQESIRAAWEVTSGILKKLKTARGPEAKMALLKQLQNDRTAKKMGYIGHVEISVDLTSMPGAARFDLQKPIVDGDWVEWELAFLGVDGIINPECENPYTVLLTFANFYRHKPLAESAVLSAAEALNLKVKRLVFTDPAAG